MSNTVDSNMFRQPDLYIIHTRRTVSAERSIRLQLWFDIPILVIHTSPQTSFIALPFHHCIACSRLPMLYTHTPASLSEIIALRWFHSADRDTGTLLDWL